MDLKRVADVLAGRAREAHDWNIASGLECRGVLADCPREACKEAVAAVAELRQAETAPPPGGKSNQDRCPADVEDDGAGHHCACWPEGICCMCSQCSWAPRVSALADGEMADADKAEVRDHLADCATCKAQLGDSIQLAALAEGVKR